MANNVLDFDIAKLMKKSKSRLINFLCSCRTHDLTLHWVNEWQLDSKKGEPGEYHKRSYIVSLEFWRRITKENYLIQKSQTMKVQLLTCKNKVTVDTHAVMYPFSLFVHSDSLSIGRTLPPAKKSISTCFRWVQHCIGIAACTQYITEYARFRIAVISSRHWLGLYVLTFITSQGEWRKIWLQRQGIPRALQLTEESLGNWQRITLS